MKSVGEQPTAISKAPSNEETGRQPKNELDSPTQVEGQIPVRNRDRQRFAMSWEEVGGLIEEGLLGPKGKVAVQGGRWKRAETLKELEPYLIQRSRANFEPEIASTIAESGPEPMPEPERTPPIAESGPADTEPERTPPIAEREPVSEPEVTPLIERAGPQPIPDPEATPLNTRLVLSQSRNLRLCHRLKRVDRANPGAGDCATG